MYHSRVFPIDPRDPACAGAQALTVWLAELTEAGRYAIQSVQLVAVPPAEPVPPADRGEPGVLALVHVADF